MKDQILLASDLETFAYFANSSGTIQARKEGARVIVLTIFLAKERTLAVEIDRSLGTAFASRFGDRVQSTARARNTPDQHRSPLRLIRLQMPSEGRRIPGAEMPRAELGQPRRSAGIKSPCW
ncbi:hypothetical protein DB354_00335 [Opitutus sp. ER46]|nr:hypothetical protein DB354_00335 [Opitutus sp. ER46]